MEGEDISSDSDCTESEGTHYSFQQLEQEDGRNSEQGGNTERENRELLNGGVDLDAELDYDEENRDYDDTSSKEGDFAGVVHSEVALISSDEGELDEYGGRVSRISTDDEKNSENMEEKAEAEANHRLSGGAEGNDTSQKMPCASEEEDKEQSEDLRMEEGEIDDLEEGELKSDDDDALPVSHSGVYRYWKQAHPEGRSTNAGEGRSWRAEDPTPTGVCKFFLRGTCTWGPDCKYLHPNEVRMKGAGPGQGPSGLNTWVATDRRGARARERPSIHSRVTFASSSNAPIGEADNPRNLPVESAWERGLRQAREAMKKASKKREEEPDFEKKRLVLAPSDDPDRSRTTDDESDDSRVNSSGRKRRDFRMSRERNVAVDESGGSGGVSVHMRVDGRSHGPRRYDSYAEPVNANEVPLGSGNRHRDNQDLVEFSSHGGNHPDGPAQRPPRIPSLIDGMKEGRMIEPPKDLGPQVIYPNGRPYGGSRRRDGPARRNRTRETSSPNERYFVPRRDQRSRSPRSASWSPARSSRSPFSRRRPLPVIRSSDRNGPPSRNYQNNNASVVISGNGQFRDPWDRCRTKRGHSRELASTTLGSVLQKARRSQERKTHSKKERDSASRSPVTSPSSYTSQSSVRSSPRERQPSTSRLSLAAAVPTRNVFDDDGSIRTTDLSSFRIPKKKRGGSPKVMSRRSDSSSRHLPRSSAGRDVLRAEVVSPMTKGRQLSAHAVSNSSQMRTAKDGVSSDVRAHMQLNEVKEKISSDESSSSFSSSSSSDDDTEPAAYRRKRLANSNDDGLPTEGIPLSPEPAAEDVSSDDDNSEPPDKNDVVSRKSSSSLEHDFPLSGGSIEGAVENDNDNELHFENGLEEDYVDNEAEKEERRAELLRQLKCVEAAIARKRNRPNV